MHSAEALAAAEGLPAPEVVVVTHAIPEGEEQEGPEADGQEADGQESARAEERPADSK